MWIYTGLGQHRHKETKMETVEIVSGTYPTVQDVVVKIVTTTTRTETSEIEVNEDLVLKTIASLQQKKAEMGASIDAEIAVNQDLLDTIRSVDRSGAVTA